MGLACHHVPYLVAFSLHVPPGKFFHDSSTKGRIRDFSRYSSPVGNKKLAYFSQLFVVPLPGLEPGRTV